MQTLNCKIIWLSDIHLRSSYFENNPKTNPGKLVKSLFNSFREVLSVEGEIDYILISGDIAFSGAKEDYLAFWDNFLLPVFALFKNLSNKPKIITIPGNHDLSWLDTEHFTTFLDSYNEYSKNFLEKNNFLNTKKADTFLKSFKEYSSLFASGYSNTTYKVDKKKEVWDNFFALPIYNSGRKNKNKLQEISRDYNDHKLFGYLIDHKKEVVLVMLNTAWFSIGDKFNDLLSDSRISEQIWADERVGKGQINNFKIATKKILDIKSKIVEYGNQVIGKNLFPLAELEEIINLHPGYTVITTMHHPLNWLNWSELYNYDGITDSSLLLNQISSFTDIFLTSHEHVPIGKKHERVNSRAVLLKSGMFMEDSIYEENGNLKAKFEHSRFSILELNSFNKNRFLKERKFLFSQNDRESKWVEKNDFEENIPLGKKSDLLTESRKQQILSNLEIFNVSNFLAHKIGSFSDSEKSNEKKETENYILYIYRLTSHTRICFIPKTSVFFEKILTVSFAKNLNIYKFLSSEISSASNNELKVHFIWLDLLLESSSKEKYQSIPVVDLLHDNEPAISSELIYNQLVKACELNFNIFRHNFFNYFEEQYSKFFEEHKNRYELNKEFQPYRNIMFINDVLSYWTFEKFMVK